jgi:hypothetical protein
MALKPPNGSNSPRVRTNVLNVQDYGATGDGTTDDTEAVEDTIADLPAAGGELYFPPGTYIVQHVVIPSNIKLTGSGIGSTSIKLKASAPVTPGGGLAYAAHRNVIVNAAGGTTGNTGIEISHLTIDGNVASNSSDEFYFGIALWAVRDVSIHDVKVKNIRGDGILIGRNPTLGQDTEDVTVSDIILENVGMDAGVGAARQGIAVVQCRRFTIRDVTADTVGGYVVDVEPDNVSQICEDFTIDGIHGYNAAACVGLGQTTGTIRRGKIGATTLRDGVDQSPAYVVSLQNCDSVTVDRPETDAATVTNRVWMDATAENISIRGYSELVKVSRNADQTNIANTTATPIEWNVRRVDRDDMHSTTDATSRKKLTAKAYGLYVATVNLRWSSTAGTYRQVFLRKNGTATIANDQRPAALAIHSVTFPAVELEQGDYIEVMVVHDAGGAIDVMLDADYSPECSLVKVS